MDGRWRDRDSAPDRGDRDPAAEVGIPTKPGPSELYRDDPEDIFTADSAPERPGPGKADNGSAPGDRPVPAQRPRPGETGESDRRPDPAHSGSRTDRGPDPDRFGADAATRGAPVDRLGPDRSGGDAGRPAAPEPGRDTPRPAPLDGSGRPARQLHTDHRDDLLGHPTDLGRRRMTLDAPLGDGLTPRGLFTGFDPTRANRSDLREDEAVEHLRDRVRTQPRLVAVMDQQRCVQRAYAIFDSGVFHGTVRHEGGMRDLDHERRVLLREDPAQTDDAKRARGRDGYRKGRHLCPAFSTSIEDPVAYLVALVRGVEDPRVQAVLERPPTRDEQPDPVKLPITQLLGADGHALCRGYKLVGDDRDRAVEDRDAWLKAGWRGEPRDQLTSPMVERVDTFDGGMIEYRFGHNQARDRYELISMFPVPPPDRPDPTARGERP